MIKQPTISPEYVKQNAELHARPKGYGGDGARHAGAIVKLAEAAGALSLLDYGAGQRRLSEALREHHKGAFHTITDYDPAIPKISMRPEAHDLVACTDVLEHVEPEYLDNVLADLIALAKRGLYLEIATRPANKTLPDGRNAHLIIETPEWWIDKLSTAWMGQYLTIAYRRIDNPGKTPACRALVVEVVK